MLEVLAWIGLGVFVIFCVYVAWGLRKKNRNLPFNNPTRYVEDLERSYTHTREKPDTNSPAERVKK
jgi:hypothetical protein